MRNHDKRSDAEEKNERADGAGENLLTKCMLNCQVDKLNFQLNLWVASASGKGRREGMPK